MRDGPGPYSALDDCAVSCCVDHRPAARAWIELASEGSRPQCDAAPTCDAWQLDVAREACSLAGNRGAGCAIDRVMTAVYISPLEIQYKTSTSSTAAANPPQFSGLR